MNRSKRSNSNIIPVTIIGFGLWSLLLVTAQPLRIKLADRLAQSAATSSGATQLADLRVAIALSPHYDGYRLQLADAYLSEKNSPMALSVLRTPNTASIRTKRADIELANGHPDRAVIALRGLGGEEAAVLMSKAYLEQNMPTQALEAVRGRPGASDQEAICHDVLNKGGLILAYRLQANHLPRTAMRVAMASPDNSIAKFSLLAELTLDHSTDNASVAMAVNYLRQGLTVDPSNLALHRQLLNTLELADDAAATQQEKGIIRALETGAV